MSKVISLKPKKKKGSTITSLVCNPPINTEEDDNEEEEEYTRRWPWLKNHPGCQPYRVHMNRAEDNLLKQTPLRYTSVQTNQTNWTLGSSELGSGPLMCVCE